MCRTRPLEVPPPAASDNSDAGSQQALDERPAAQDDHLCATQAYNGSSDEDDVAPAVGKVIKIDKGQDGESYKLPGGSGVDVLLCSRSAVSSRTTCGTACTSPRLSWSQRRP